MIDHLNHSKYLVIIRFLFGGLVNTGVTYALYILLEQFFLYQIAYALSYCAGIIFSYWFNTIIVFKTTLSWQGLIKYPVVYIVQYCASALLLAILVENLHIDPKIAPLMVVIATIPVTFILSRWALRKKNK